MTVRVWISPLTAAVLLASCNFSFGQGAVPDEVFGSHGAATQDLALTAAQKNAIYNAIRQQRVRPNAPMLRPAVGAEVPPTVALSELPNDVVDAPWGEFLKYAMVADDVVVVDPARMRIVDIIHGNSLP